MLFRIESSYNNNSTTAIILSGGFVTLINIIFGEKGTGKTKQLLNGANNAVSVAKGNIIFIDLDNSYMYDLDTSIRFVNINEYGIDSLRSLYGFLCGLAASDFDLEYVYIDRFCKIVANMGADLEPFFKSLAAFTDKRGITVNLTFSGDPAAIPDFMRAYIAG